MSLCDSCLAEKNEWVASVQDIAQQPMSKPADSSRQRGGKLTPIAPGDRGRRATEIVRSQIKVIEKICAREHQEGESNG